MITLKRAYDAASAEDGTRFLVERLWPRGVSKATLRVEAWLKDAAPSTELRKWFNHDPDKWDEFRRLYGRELDACPEGWQPIVSAARRGPVTLVYSSHDTAHNNAVALQEYLTERSRRPSKPVASAARARSGPGAPRVLSDEPLPDRTHQSRRARPSPRRSRASRQSRRAAT